MLGTYYHPLEVRTQVGTRYTQFRERLGPGRLADQTTAGTVFFFIDSSRSRLVRYHISSNLTLGAIGKREEEEKKEKKRRRVGGVWVSILLCRGTCLYFQIPTGEVPTYMYLRLLSLRYSIFPSLSLLSPATSFMPLTQSSTYKFPSPQQPSVAQPSPAHYSSQAGAGQTWNRTTCPARGM